MRLSIAVTAALMLWGVAASADPPDAVDPASQTVAGESVRAVVQRSLPFIEREGAAWIEKRQCVTCHQVPFMLWSLNAAASRGFTVDSDKLSEWNAWGTDYTHFMAPADREKYDRDNVLQRNVDTTAQLLLAGEAAGAAPQGEWVALYRDNLIRTQQDSGLWAPGGQLPGQKRPKRETEEVTTLWTIVALMSYGTPDETLRPVLDRAREELSTAADGKSTEWWSAQLIVARMQGETARADRFRAELLQKQREDGGWGWLWDEESDAFGTGLALYALARDGVSPQDASIQRGQAFLISTQQPDGSWTVRGTKESARTKVTPTATYWGTCWGVLGLVETLDVPTEANPGGTDHSTPAAH